MASLMEYADKELRRAGFFDDDSDYGGLVGPAVMKMVEAFAGEGHSGYSAGLCIHLFSRVASYKPLTALENPLKTGEFHDVSEYSGEPPEKVLQSTVRPSLFSNDSGKTWHDIDISVPWWRRVFLRQRVVKVTFPYMPE